MYILCRQQRKLSKEHRRSKFSRSVGGGVQYYEQHFCPYVVDELLGETLTEVGSKVVKIALD